jgi:hypothetical protein
VNSADRAGKNGKTIGACGVVLMIFTAVTRAGAFPPQTTIVPVDATFVNEFDCPFPLQEQVSGTIRDTLYYDRNSTLTREFLSPQFQGSVTVTWMNPKTGTSLTSHEASTLIIYYNPDGSFRTATNQGLTFHVSVAGEGLLLLDVGRLVFEQGRGITFEVGPHQELDGDTGAFCAYVAQ